MAGFKLVNKGADFGADEKMDLLEDDELVRGGRVNGVLLLIMWKEGQWCALANNGLVWCVEGGSMMCSC